MTILDILREIDDTPGKNDKLAILEREKENLLLKEVFTAAYNPFYNYYLRKFDETITGSFGEPKVSLAYGLSILIHVLNARKLTGRDALDTLETHCKDMHPHDVIVIRRILDGNLQCGCSGNSANKVWKGCVPTYPVMLASSDNEKNRAKIKFPAFAEEKVDGMRINVWVVNDKVTYFSRNGRVVDAETVDLDADFVALAKSSPYRNVMFDGELLVVNPDGSRMERKTGNGICNKAIKGTISYEEKRKFKFIIFDMVEVKISNNSLPQSDRPFHERTAELKMAFHTTKLKMKQIEMVYQQVVNSWDEANLVYQKMIANGLEGAIIKNRDGMWEDKRSKNLVKMKQFIEDEFIIKAIEEGTNKYEGMMGALHCASADGSIEFSVGTGFTDDDRVRLFDDGLIGRTVTVMYNEIIEREGSETKSLFLPVFVELREDKGI